ncbi:MAG: hypothetical protein H6767_05480 [Candidatus Peribacteria bacterium]|nr:MAG: hypothetical protein H6767_05480 [Candidatus Peribacteria bacterium]
MKEFSSIPEVAEIFQTIPELKKIITDVLPGIIRSIDRTTLQTSMSRLFTSLESSIAIIRDLHPEEPVPVDLKLGIITSVTEFTTSILNEQTLESILQ